MKDHEKNFLSAIRFSLAAIALILLLLVVLMVPLLLPGDKEEHLETQVVAQPDTWSAPDSTTIEKSAYGDLILYGQELVAHTASYLGPTGKVAAISNGMNCQNCHLKAGKKIFGNNFSSVASTYPKFRARSGSIESIEKRVNDCLERSLNGLPLESESREMKAMIAYIKWVGKDVPKGAIPHGAGLVDLPLLDRAADPEKGKIVFENMCSRCHGEQGVKHPNGTEWLYPPLWGPNSFNTGAGIFRLSRMAGYIKMNMPNESSQANQSLDDEQAWDVAAYINSMPRPVKDISDDWPDISTKPFDHPFGPFTDSFSEEQHKFGPFKSIIDAHKKE